MTRVAIVTGSNQGIGFATVRGLCKQFDGDVILTARNEERGKKAVEDLNKEGLNPKFHQLDITSVESIKKVKKFLEDNYGGIDVLVNNAAIAFPPGEGGGPFEQQVAETMPINFWGTLNVCNELFPLLRPHARVVNVSSRVTTYFSLPKISDDLKKRIFSINTIEGVEKFITEFEEAVKAGNFEDKGWCKSAYGVSKIGVNMLTVIQMEQMRKDPRDDILVNCCCPGFVKTNLNNYRGHKSIEDGADTELYLATLPQNTESPAGNFVGERKIIPWSYDAPTPQLPVPGTK